MKTLLVTGAAGFIGSNFVRLAIARGYNIVALDSLTYAGSLENLKGISQHFTFVKEDIRSSSIRKILDAADPMAIVNFAAESHVDRSILNPLIFVETNILGVANLLNHSLQFWKKNNERGDFRFLQISTDEVFGSLGKEGKFSETTPINPNSPYSASKAAADHLVTAWHHTYGLPTLITHCSNNYGPHQFPEKLIPLTINKALKGDPIPVYGNGKNIRDWIHVEDHCNGLFLALEKGTPGEKYCLGGRSEMENIELVKKICSELDRLRPRKDGISYSNQITFVTDRLGHDFRYAIDDSFAEKAIGFIRKFNLDSGLRSTIDWYLNNEAWAQAMLEKTVEEK